MRLSGIRYDEIEREVIKLFAKLIINKFPLDCFEICEQLGFEVVPYSTLSETKRKMLNIGSEDQSLTSLTPEFVFYNAMRDIAERLHIKA